MIRNLIFVAVLVFAPSALATSVLFSVSNIGANTWRADYTIVNDTLSVAIEEITIYFDYELYTNLSTVSDAPAGWDSLVVQPDTGLPDHGFFDSLALDGGIAPGAALSGFSLTFDYLGLGTPEAQLWQIVDPDTFAVLDQGMSSIPVPAALWLFLSALAATRAIGYGSRSKLENLS